MIGSRPESLGSQTTLTDNSVPMEDLRKLAGLWVAQSADGSHIIAHAKDLVELDRRVIEAGENPEEVFLLRVADSNMVFSGAEFQ